MLNRQKILIYEKEISTMKINEIMEIYEEVYMKNNIKQTTYMGYKVNIDHHILPVLGDKDSEELQYIDIDLLVIKLRQKGLNNSTIRYVLKVLKQALNFAEKRRYIRFNIMTSYEMPKKNTYTYQTLSDNEINLLLDDILSSDDDIKLCVLLMTCYGMRRGECLGLKYSDINENIMSIRRTSQYVKKEFLTTDCKTEKSKRDILLMPEHIPIIENYHINRQKNLDGFLMRKKNGNRITQNILQRDYKILLKRLELPNVRIHDLRHSYATMMVRNGVNPKIISTVLGHSNIGITMDLYSHADISMQEACLNVIGNKIVNG